MYPPDSSYDGKKWHVRTRLHLLFPLVHRKWYLAIRYFSRNKSLKLTRSGLQVARRRSWRPSPVILLLGSRWKATRATTMMIMASCLMVKQALMKEQTTKYCWREQRIKLGWWWWRLCQLSGEFWKKSSPDIDCDWNLVFFFLYSLTSEYSLSIYGTSYVRKWMVVLLADLVQSSVKRAIFGKL